jgi:DNA processing protein
MPAGVGGRRCTNGGERPMLTKGSPPVDGVAGPAARAAAGATLPDELLLARAYLSRVAEPGSLPVSQFVNRFGPIEAAAMIRRGDVPEDVRRATAARQSSCDPEADLTVAARHGIDLVVPESDRWPHYAFSGLCIAAERRLASWAAGQRTARYGGEPTVPLALWVRGPYPVEEVGTVAVAIVGARAATPYGEQLAAEFGHDLAAHGMAVVSGGAFGIDAAAHRGALAASGITVLVAANGLDSAYPRAHAKLFEQVSATGLLISESPPGSLPHRQRFLSRNRLVAAFTAGTVVVEAAARSGALNTAGHCQLLGRPVMAVPGPVTSALSVGCHALLRHPTSPAALVTSAADVLALVGPPGSGPEEDRVGHRRRTMLDGLDAVALAVADGLPARGWVSEDELAVRSGVDTASVLRAVAVLRLAGVIESGTDGHRLRRPTKAG